MQYFANLTNLSEIRKILYPLRNIGLIDRETYLYYIEKISQDNIDMRTYYSIKIDFLYHFNLDKWS